MSDRLQSLSTHKTMCAKPSVTGFDVLVACGWAESEYRGDTIYYFITDSGERAAERIRKATNDTI
jgi:hypothetical protein